MGSINVRDQYLHKADKVSSSEVLWRVNIKQIGLTG